MHAVTTIGVEGESIVGGVEDASSLIAVSDVHIDVITASVGIQVVAIDTAGLLGI